jgi:hypothetical protein
MHIKAVILRGRLLGRGKEAEEGDDVCESLNHTSCRLADDFTCDGPYTNFNSSINLLAIRCTKHMG